MFTSRKPTGLRETTCDKSISKNIIKSRGGK